MPGMKSKLVNSPGSSCMAKIIWWIFHWSRSWMSSSANMFITFGYGRRRCAGPSRSSPRPRPATPTPSRRPASPDSPPPTMATVFRAAESGQRRPTTGRRRRPVRLGEVPHHDRPSPAGADRRCAARATGAWGREHGVGGAAGGAVGGVSVPRDADPARRDTPRPRSPPETRTAGRARRRAGAAVTAPLDDVPAATAPVLADAPRQRGATVRGQRGGEDRGWALTVGRASWVHLQDAMLADRMNCCGVGQNITQ